MTNERVRERLESIQTKVLNQHDEIVRLRGELEAAIRRCATAERRVWDLEHAPPPAPSGWQQRIAAMPSGAAYVHVEIRDETGAVLDSFNVDAREVGQHAKDALPPSSSESRVDEIAERLVEEISGYLRSPHSNAGRVLTHVRKAIADALPPVSEASPAKPWSIVCCDALYTREHVTCAGCGRPLKWEEHTS